ncbi:MAG: hypothetical protein D6712_21615 [Chloroflexi bacterium]|nr:MAG: hypothetical protein D6712_21615 [Chloroflexota bacterium]
MWRTALLLTIGLLLGVQAVQAQDGGQFCVQTFEDRNANGIRDPGEPPFTRGITADLADANGVIVASKLLDDSPTATSGFICFQYLTNGNYTVTVRSAEHEATTATSETRAITPTSIEVFEYGAQRLVIAPEVIAPSQTQSEVDARILFQRIFFAGLGAGIVIFAMVVSGAIIGYVFFWRKLARTPQAITDTGTYPVTGTGTHPQVPIPDDDSQWRKPE